MAEWYYTANKQQRGPVSLAELRQLATQGLLQPGDLVWRDGMSDWMRASSQSFFNEAANPGAQGTAADRSPPPIEDDDVNVPRRRARPLREDYDEDLEDDRPRRRRARRSQGGLPLAAKIGLIAGGIVVFLLIVGVGMYFMVRTDTAEVAAGVGTFNGLLGANDLRDPKRGGPSRVYNVRMVANRTYVIDLRSSEFDSFLRLEDNAFRQLAQDDDSGGGLNARIVFRCSRTDNYRVIATSLGQGRGAYNLSIREN